LGADASAFPAVSKKNLEKCEIMKEELMAQKTHDYDDVLRRWL
jgi:hypothetical protein